MAKMINMHNKNCIALGFFDGLHKGHVDIITAASRLVLPGGILYAATFSDEIQKFTHKTDRLLTTLDERLRQLASVGATPVILPSDKAFFSLSKEEFLRFILTEFNLAAIVCGEDFHFGAQREGDVKYLSNYCKQHNILAEIVPLARENDIIVSSTYIKKLLSAGRIAEANSLLRFPFSIFGVIERGTGTGRVIGFPTANIAVDNSRQLPLDGVYVTFSYIENHRYLSITNVGSRPTFLDNAAKIETHFINTDHFQQYYGKMLKLEFVARLRDVIKFSSTEALVSQLVEDCANAKRIIGE